MPAPFNLMSKPTNVKKGKKNF